MLTSEQIAEMDKVTGLKPAPQKSQINASSRLAELDSIDRGPESIPEKIGNFTGGTKIAQGLGQGLAQKKNAQALDFAATQGADIQTQLIKRIREKKATGEDTSHLQKTLEDLGGNIQSIGDETGDVLNPEHLTGKQVIGDALQLATTAGGAKVAGAVAGKATQATGLVRGALQGAKVGAIGGAAVGGLTGVSSGLKNDEDASGIIKEGIKGVGIGALTGGAVGAVTGAVAGKIKTGKPENIVKNRVKVLKEVENGKAPVRNYVSKQEARGIDVKSNLAKTDLLKDAVDTTGTIRTKQPGGAIEQYNEFLKPQEGIVSQKLAEEGKSVAIKDVEKEMVDAVNVSKIKGSAKATALENVKKEIAGLTLDADEAGNIPVATIHDAKVSKYANINYLNPESGTADKLIAKTLKEIVENNSSASVKELNKELSQHYATIGYLEKLDGSKVQGGKLGKYFAQTLGGIVGSHFGPVGTIAGAELAGAMKGAQLGSTFSKGIGKELEMSPAMQEAVGSIQSKSAGALNKSQNTTIAPTKNAISDTIPIVEGKAKKLSTLHPDDAGEISDFIDLVRVPKTLGNISEKAKTDLEIAARRIAEAFGINPDISNRKLANELEKLMQSK